jgi:hypothetical protein
MPYVRDEESMYFDTGDEELFGSLAEGKWEEPVEATVREHRRYQRGATPLPFQRPRPFQPRPGATGASIQTPAGQAQVQFPKPVATQEGVNDLARELKAEVAGLAASIKKVNETLDQNTAIVDKKINLVSADLKRSGEMSPMMLLLPLLLQKTPTLTKLTVEALNPATGGIFTPGTTPDFTKPVDFKVDSQAVTQDDSTTTLLLVMMMMGGGMGGNGGGDSSNMMMMMMMVLLLSGGLGKKA